jgi:hypothetical protein
MTGCREGVAAVVRLGALVWHLLIGLFSEPATSLPYR